MQIMRRSVFRKCSIVLGLNPILLTRRSGTSGMGNTKPGEMSNVLVVQVIFAKSTENGLLEMMLLTDRHRPVIRKLEDTAHPAMII